MRFSFYLVLNILSVSLAFAKKDQYAGYKVYKIRFDNRDQQNAFSQIINDDIDLWRRPSFEHNVVGLAMVPRNQIAWFEDKLDEFSITKHVHIDDVYEYLTEKDISSGEGERSYESRNFNFTSYHRYNEILAYLESLQETYTTSTSITLSLHEYGRTIENRSLVFLTLTNRATDMEKPVIIVEAGIIPREWITIPAALNIVERLLETSNADYINNFEWVIVPVVNPDGYEYSHTDIRLWTKNLNIASAAGFICPGVNINRNFDYYWGVSDSSSSPCSHLYAGSEPFSEIETQFLRSILEDYGSRTALYISLQNNGGLISYPWFYEFAASGLFIQHHTLGFDMVNAMEGDYRLGSGAVNYGARVSGTSSDYVFSNGILYTFNIDIEQTDNGFDIPEENISDVVRDVWRAVSTAVSNFV